MPSATRPRRDSAPVDNGNRCALLRWQGREGNWLIATVPSRSRSGVSYTVRVHLVTDAAICTCAGYTSHKHCWHVDAAHEGAWRYEETLEVQRTLDSDWLAQLVNDLSPSRLDGVVVLAWLAAQRVLAERSHSTMAA